MQISIHNIYLLLGTNMGDRSNNLLVAKQKLEAAAGKIVQQSSVYETAPWGNQDQLSFLNQVIEIVTEKNPFELLSAVLAIELEMGRVREVKWGPRLIDIDILFYSDMVVQNENLTIPHPALHERRFTLAPLAEIAADFRHPILNKTMNELLASCTDPLEVKKTML